MLTLLTPWALVLLLVPLFLLALNKRQSSKPAALRVPSLQQWQAVTHSREQVNTTQSLRKPWLKCAIWLCFTVAAANPTWYGDPVPQPIEGRDILLAVDISGSMEIRDMPLNGRLIDRLTATKAVVEEFVKARQGDRLGLIVYGSHAYMHVPLTHDLETLNTLLQEAQTSFAGDGTAIGDAIGLGIKRLHELNHNQRIMVLLTDGENTAGELSPIEAAKLAAEQSLKIYTIGLGSRQSMMGRFRRGNGLDETTLNQIATLTGGQAFRAQDTAQLLDIYNYIDELEPQPDDAKSIRPQISLAWYCIATGLALLGLGLLFNSVSKRQVHE